MAEIKNKERLEDAEKQNLSIINRLKRALNESEEPIRLTSVFPVEHQKAISISQRFLKKMCDKGKVEAIMPPGEHIHRYKGLEELKEEFIPFDLREDLTLLHDPNMGTKLFEALREKSGIDLSFEEVIDTVNQKYNWTIEEDSDKEIAIFIELLYYLKTYPFYHNVKYIKNIKKDGENYWRFIDREKENYNRLLKEKEKTEVLIEDIEKKLEIAKKEHEDNLIKVESMRFAGDPMLEKQIEDNAAKIKEIENTNSTLHRLFKKKKIEENERQIKELEDFNERTRTELLFKRRQADELVSQELNKTNGPILELQTELEKQKKSLLNTELNLEKVNMHR